MNLFSLKCEKIRVISFKSNICFCEQQRCWNSFNIFLVVKFAENIRRLTPAPIDIFFTLLPKSKNKTQECRIIKNELENILVKLNFKVETITIRQSFGDLLE